MIRHLHPTDTPALLPFKQRSGPDEAWSLKRALAGGRGSFPLFKYSSIALSPRAWQSCWVLTRRASVQALLRASTRSGPLAWDVSEIYVARRDPDVALMALEQVAFPAGAAGARRIFLRMRSDSELSTEARAAGYRPAYSETVYTAPSSDELRRSLEELTAPTLTPMSPEDSHAAYRLYCAAVPIDVRTRVGQVLEEWESAQEPLGRKGSAFAVREPGTERLEAMVRLAELAGHHYVSWMRTADSALGLETFLAPLRSSTGDKPVAAMVRSYDAGLGEFLRDFGFTKGETYDVMIKTLAVPVTEAMPGFAAVER